MISPEDRAHLLAAGQELQQKHAQELAASGLAPDQQLALCRAVALMGWQLQAQHEVLHRHMGCAAGQIFWRQLQELTAVMAAQTCHRPGQAS